MVRKEQQFQYLSRDGSHLILDQTFVSASLDGVIVVWQSDTLNPLKKLSYPEGFYSSTPQMHCFTNTVNHLLVLEKVCEF